MAKEKNMGVQAVRNRNNRKRGSQFEKKIAEILDMNVVPYSGTNSQFGWSDVRDSEVKSKAWWMGECKNMTLKLDEPYTILKEWIDKMIARAYDTGSLPFLAFMQSGKPQKFILLDERTVSILEAKLCRGELAGYNSKSYRKASCKAVNMKIPQSDLKELASGNYKAMKCRLDGEPWYTIMTITTFIDILRETNMHYKWATGGE